MLSKWIAALFRDRRGATAVEYGLILALIVLTMLVAFVQLAGSTTGLWNNISADFTRARGG